MATLQSALLSQRAGACAQTQPGRSERSHEGGICTAGRKKAPKQKRPIWCGCFKRASLKPWRLWKLCGIDDVLSYLQYPQPHRVRISSTNPLERLNLEIRRRTRVVGIFPHTGSCLRLIGMLLVEKNEDWLTIDKAYLHF